MPLKMDVNFANLLSLPSIVKYALEGKTAKGMNNYTNLTDTIVESFERYATIGCVKVELLQIGS